MIRKTIKIILVLLCMISIFIFSNDSAEASSKKSDTLIIRITTLFVRGDLTKQEKEKIIDKYVVFLRKSAHFIIYSILGLLLISLVIEYQPLNKKSILLSFLIAFLYAISDEFHQTFIPGRSGEIRDILIDSSGAFVGILIYNLSYKLKNKFQKK